jgi:small-conductance mechanosensitive channel
LSVEITLVRVEITLVRVVIAVFFFALTYQSIRNFMLSSKKYMGSEIHPGVMSAQQCEIQISRVTYLLIKNVI